MAEQIDDAASKIVVKYDNKQPLDLLDFTASLTAFGRAYRHYQAGKEGPQHAARLKIGRLRSGSVIAELVPVLEAADWLLQHRDFVGPFVAHFGDVMEQIRSFPPRARKLDKTDVRAAKTVVAPVAKDEGSQVTIYAAAGSTVVTNTFNIGSAGARDVRRHADILLNAMPYEDRFDGEPMILFQMRDGPPGAAGDYGIIDQFSREPVKIRWASDEIKAEVLGRPENVFDLVYFVSGIVKTAGGVPVAYVLYRLEDTALKPPEQRHG